MHARTLMIVAWPAFLAACLLEAVVFALLDPLELHWAGQSLPWSRQVVYAGCFLVFWLTAMVASGLTVLLGGGAQPRMR